MLFRGIELFLKTSILIDKCADSCLNKLNRSESGVKSFFASLESVKLSGLHLPPCLLRNVFSVNRNSLRIEFYSIFYYINVNLNSVDSLSGVFSDRCFSRVRSPCLMKSIRFSQVYRCISVLRFTL